MAASPPEICDTSVLLLPPLPATGTLPPPKAPVANVPFAMPPLPPVGVGISEGITSVAVVDGSAEATASALAPTTVLIDVQVDAHVTVCSCCTGADAGVVVTIVVLSSSQLLVLVLVLVLLVDEDDDEDSSTVTVDVVSGEMETVGMAGVTVVVTVPLQEVESVVEEEGRGVKGKGEPFAEYPVGCTNVVVVPIAPVELAPSTSH